MPTLEIKQIKDLTAKVDFEGGEWTVDFQNPFTPRQEEELRWYFEDHLNFPMLEIPRAEHAAASIEPYGNRLFNSLFSDRDLHAAFKEHRSGDVRINITGSPDFHRLHWEALWEPGAPNPLAYRTAITRRVATENAKKIRQSTDQPTIRVLVVVARPGGADDVGYRTISRPLVETLHQASLAVELDFLRPGTFAQLKKHLSNKPQGHYHAIHFDGHGAVTTTSHIEHLRREGKLLFHAGVDSAVATPNQSRAAYLFFESPAKPGNAENIGDAVPAVEVAKLVNDSQVPVVILNACQSGKQEAEPETNLASRLAQAGVRTVLAMGYSVTVTAARNFMETFYREAFKGQFLSEAVTHARQSLNQDKHRNASFALQVELEDWMLPVLYETEPVRFQVRATVEEERAILRRQTELFDARPLKHRFWGRDLDVLNIERSVLSDKDRNILLIEGMGGTGKTTLLQHLGWWWQTTGLVSRVFNFEYDQKPWTRQQILFDIARQLGMTLDPDERLQQEAVAKKLRAECLLLVLDNLESVTGEQLAIGQALPESERSNLREFLAKLRGGKTLVLIGSRGKEEWLAAGTFGDNVYALRGLDREAASGFGDEILRAAGADPSKIRVIPEYRDLLKLLDGHPLALQVILSNLAVKSPAEVLHALREGDIQLNKGETRTDSILKCIDYSHSNLSPEARNLLQCLAPFTGVVFLPYLDKYIQLLRQQPELSALPWDLMRKVLEEAERWGLVRTEGSILHLQPVFPFFLRSRGVGSGKTAVETAFREHYQSLCAAIYSAQESKDPGQRQAGQWLAKLEYENALRALDLSLAARMSILQPYGMLSGVLDETKDNAAGLALAERVTAELATFPEHLLAGPFGIEMVGVIDNAASRFLLLKRYKQAEGAYRRALAISRSNASASEETKARHSASIYHQLGMVAEEQRQWEEAEKNYREALRIKVEFNDRYAQASTYHQLGRVAQEQRQWEEVEKNYREALRICVEFNDRYAQAGTYHQLGSVAQEQRQWEEAEKNYREALRIYVEFNDRYEQAGTYHNLGRVAQEQRQWEEAEKNYREALRIQVEFNDRYAQASTYHNLGRVAQEQRQWEEAEKNYREALRIYVEFNDRYEQAGTYHQLGRVAQEQRQWDEAENNYREALRIQVEFNDRYAQGMTYHQLGSVAEEQRQWDEAENNYREALRIQVEFNDRYAQGMTYHQLGSVAEEQRQWEEAEKNYREAVVIFTKFQDQHSLGVVFGSLARLAPDSLGLQGRIAEVLGVPSNQLDELFGRSTPSPEPLASPIHNVAAPVSLEAEATGGTAESPASPEKPGDSIPPDESEGRYTFGQPQSQQHATDAYRYEVWFATNRQPISPLAATTTFTNHAAPDGSVVYGKCLVDIPKTHMFGSLGTQWWKRWTRFQFEDDHLKLRQVDSFTDGTHFFDALRNQLGGLDEGERQMLVYLHGYNVTFEEAALRSAQMGFDLKIQGATAFFSWPSCGTLEGYFADADRIAASEKAIAQFLIGLANGSAAQKIHIVAHSMGNRGFARAMQRIFAQAATHSAIKFGHIILAAPDIEVSLFRELAAIYPQYCDRTTMYVSSRDRALGMAKWLQSSERAGFTPPVTVVPGIDTIEVTDMDLTLLGHGYYAEADGVIRDMFDLLHFNAPPDKRARTRQASPTEPYWVIAR